MNEDQVRQLAREAVLRHFTGASPSPQPIRVTLSAPHPSRGMYSSLQNDTDACLIEPAVACNHCGYCKSHGH